MQSINPNSQTLKNDTPKTLMQKDNVEIDFHQIYIAPNVITMTCALKIEDTLISSLEITYSSLPLTLLPSSDGANNIEIAANTVCIRTLHTLFPTDVELSFTEEKKLVLDVLHSPTFMEMLLDTWEASLYYLVQSEQDFDDKAALIKSLLTQQTLQFTYIIGDDVVSYTVLSKMN